MPSLCSIGLYKHIEGQCRPRPPNGGGINGFKHFARRNVRDVTSLCKALATLGMSVKIFLRKCDDRSEIKRHVIS
jgi:hypothetical protein